MLCLWDVIDYRILSLLFLVVVSRCLKRWWRPSRYLYHITSPNQTTILLHLIVTPSFLDKLIKICSTKQILPCLRTAKSSQFKGLRVWTRWSYSRNPGNGLPDISRSPKFRRKPCPQMDWLILSFSLYVTILVSFFHCILNLVQMLIPSEYKRLVDLLCDPDMQDNAHGIFNDRDIMPTLFHRILERLNRGDFSDKVRCSKSLIMELRAMARALHPVPRLFVYPLF